MVPVTTPESNALLEGSQRSWATLLRDCRQALLKTTFSLDGCLARAVMANASADAFAKNAEDFVRQYQFSETNIATLGAVRWLDSMRGQDAAPEVFAQGIEQLRRKKPQAFGINYLGGATFFL